MLHGTLNPGVKAQAGWYFAYNVGANCTGGEKAPVNPRESKSKSSPRKRKSPNSSRTCSTQSVSSRKTCSIRPSGRPCRSRRSPCRPVARERASLGTYLVRSPSGAKLEAQVNPNNQETTYVVRIFHDKQLPGTPHGVTVPEVIGAQRTPQRNSAKSSRVSLRPAGTGHDLPLPGRRDQRDRHDPYGRETAFTTLGHRAAREHRRGVRNRAVSANVTGTVNPEGVGNLLLLPVRADHRIRAEHRAGSPGVSVGAGTSAGRSPGGSSSP